MSTIVDLSPQDCATLLESALVGRIAVVVDGHPLVFPVNYRWVTAGPRAFVALRTRPGNPIDRAGEAAAFEVDGIDAYHRTGWSVLVQGKLHRLDTETTLRELVDPHPWLTEERDAWLLLEAHEVTGRQLTAPDTEWAFHIRGYL
jgi:nitroimidazol reductase NimA-like FMN-containing flavoprotein (pyridoxamine 5'-phosphate oxidase superfamily)